MSDLWDVLVRNFPQFRSGFLVTLRLVAISFVVAMVAGAVVGALRASPVRWLRWLGGIYVEFFRNGCCQRAIDVRYGDNGGFGNARRQVPDVNLAEPSRADDADFEFSHVSW